MTTTITHTTTTPRRSISNEEFQARRRNESIAAALTWLEAVDLVWSTERNLNGERAAEDKIGDLLDRASNRYHNLSR